MYDKAGDPPAVSAHLRRLRAGHDADFGEARELPLEYRIGAQQGVVLDHGDVSHESGEVDRGLHAGIAAPDHRHALALEQRAVTMRTIGDALVAVFALARHVDLAPARARRDHHGLRFQAQRRSRAAPRSGLRG